MNKMVGLVSLVLVSGWLYAQETRIYYLGNSLTDEVKYDAFEKLAESAGHEVTWGRHMIPGIPIHALYACEGKGFMKGPFGHWDKALREYEWDVVTMQPFGAPFESQFEGAIKFCNEIVRKSPNAQIYIYAQWPGKGKGPDWDRGFAGPQDRPGFLKPNTGFDYEETVAQLPEPLKTRYADRSLRHQYEVMAHGLRLKNIMKKPPLLIPTGHSMQLLGQKMRAGQMPGYDTPWDLYSDGVHVLNIGSYIVACSFYATIFGESPVGLPVGEYQGEPGQRDDYVHITPELAKRIQETVWEVVTAHPMSGVTSDDPVRVATPILDAAVAGESYFYELLPAYGAAPYAWNIAEGALPEGLMLGDDGTLSGKTESMGVSKVTFEVTDANGRKASRAFELAVQEDVPPVIPAQSLPTLAVGSFASIILKGEGGNGALTWSVTDGALPPGLQLANDGTISGAPGKEGTYGFTVSVVDSDSDRPETAERAMELKVGPPTEEIAFARKLDTEPNMDGDPSNDDWQLRYEIKKTVIGDGAQISGAFDVAWDDKNLYVAVKVKDPDNDPPSRNEMVGDYIAFCIDGLNNREDTYNADDRWAPYPRGQRWGNREKMIGNRLGMGQQQTEIDGGYFVEFSISWRNLGLAGHKDPVPPYTVLGLDIDLIDNAKDGTPENKTVWKGSAENHLDPSRFGTVVLAE